MDGMTARIVGATPSELLVITYELTIDSIENAVKALKENNDSQFRRYINKSQNLTRELINTLNLSYEISLDLMRLYLFVNKSIITGLMKKSEQSLNDAKKVLSILLDGFSTVSNEHKKEQKPIVDNAQRLVAGFTYGKGMLNETVMNNGVNRGFRA
ncbi:MAG: hypothetical protein A2Y24_04550 [Clostridiales bacterium GWE2_32_10]|nr:MAG: hypothetical protein A2Y24_04550 [Clostridiales bacterium GWE2_32_10]DAB30900.1 MAG TPA: hypothetical protein CFH84_01485 [Sulfurimonas sp. UBA12504]HBY21521.1 hypothetical protein [Clostridiales bacterium]